MSVLLRVGMGMALAAAALAGAASPANAHAVLLRTEPSPQATLPRPPSEIRLEFSEPVEVAFGAVRLFDVDGQRVETGSIRLADRDRAVVVPLPQVADGTYTVTWRVASADGHPVSGGFVFYVGAPSAISAVPVDTEGGAGAALSWPYGAVRFLWFTAVVAVIGLLVGRLWVWTPSVRTLGLSESPAAARFRSDFRVVLPVVWAVLAVTGVLWLVFEASALSGLSLVSALDPDVIGEIMSTTFGRWWTVGLVLTALLLVPVGALVRRRPLVGWKPSVWIAAVAVLVTGLALASAMTGHARTDRWPGLAVPALAVHLLSAGLWVGGLGALVVLGGRAWRKVPGERRPELLRQLVGRFSRVAVAAVIAVVATGVINSLASVGPISELWSSAYGRVLTAKVVLLGLALLLGARHLWIVPRRLAVAEAAGGNGNTAVISFQRSSGVELGLLAGTLVLAAALVALVPGRSIALAGQGAVNEEGKVGNYTAQLFIDPSTVGPNQLHLTFVDASGLGASDVVNTEVTLGREGATPEPVAMRLISPGHFVGDVTLPSPGDYRLSVALGQGASGPSTTFEFRLSD